MEFNSECNKKVNWSAEERDLLVEKCQDSSVATGKFTATLTASEKGRFWANVTESVNSISKTKRTVEQVKKKWIDLKSQTKKKTMSHLQEVKKNRRGPAPVLDLEDWESKVLQAIPKCSVEGIANGIDTFHQNNIAKAPQEIPDLPVSGRTEGVTTSQAETTPKKSKYEDATVSEAEPEQKKSKCERKTDTNAATLIREQTEVLKDLVSAVNSLNQSVISLKHSIDKLEQQDLMLQF